MPPLLHSPSHRFKQINAAYEVLGNPLKRKEYDAELRSRDELELTSDVAEGEGGIRIERRPKTDQETEDFLRRMKAVGFIVGYFFFVVYFYMNWFWLVFRADESFLALLSLLAAPGTDYGTTGKVTMRL